MTSSAQEDPQDLSAIVQTCGDSYFVCGEHEYVWSTSSTRFRISPNFPNLPNQLATKVCRVKPYGYGQKLDVTKQLLETMKTSNALLFRGHPNIVPVFGFVNNMGTGDLPSPAVVIPYYGNGDALRYLAQNPKASKHQITIDVAKALEFMHSLDPPVIHGNLKASNILIGDDGHALISDIGFHTVISQCGFTDVNTLGSCRWTAPEVLRPPQELEDEGQSLSVLASRETDVYAFGMTALEIYTGKKPFSTWRNDLAIVVAVDKGKRPRRPESSEINDGMWSLMCDCWKDDPKQRPSMAEVHERLIENLM